MVPSGSTGYKSNRNQFLGASAIRSKKKMEKMIDVLSSDIFKYLNILKHT